MHDLRNMRSACAKTGADSQMTERLCKTGKWLEKAVVSEDRLLACFLNENMRTLLDQTVSQKSSDLIRINLEDQ